MTSKTSTTDPISAASDLDPELLEKVIDFVKMFELVFEIDWPMTEECLQDDSRPYFIRDDGTFLSPGVEDESNNWFNRGSLLARYRDLVDHLADLVGPEGWERIQ